jgi:carbonic anhydrase/acetyltransferase-like protein (isoleucine patch superfamily)
LSSGPHIGAGVTLEDPAFIHPTALIFGRVTIGRGASVWPYAVFRAEVFEIVVGERTNIQDFVMIHVGNRTPTIIGRDCSITHHATLHGCEIGDACLIGIGATVMDGAKIGANSIVAGHAIVTEGSVFPENSIIGGSPARLIKSRDNGRANRRNALFYHLNALNYARGVDRLQPSDLEQLRLAASEGEPA